MKEPQRCNELWSLALLHFSSLPYYLPPPLNSTSVFFFSVPGVSELCSDTLQPLQCMLNYGRTSEATTLMKHAARSHISLWRGETCCWGVNYLDSKYHSNHHAKTVTRSHLPPLPCHPSLVSCSTQPSHTGGGNAILQKDCLLPREHPKRMEQKLSDRKYS